MKLMSKRLRRNIISSAALSLGMAFQAVTGLTAQNIPPSRSDLPPRPTGLAMQVFNNPNSPHPLYASEETYAKLNPIIANSLTAWAGKPVMILSKGDLYDNRPLSPRNIMVMTDQGPASLASLERAQAADSAMHAIIANNPDYFQNPDLKNPEKAHAYTDVILSYLLSESAAAMNLPLTAETEPSAETPTVCLITTHNLREQGQKQGTDFLSDIPPNLIAQIPGGTQDWNTFILMHEALSHCGRNHISDSFGKALENETEADALAVAKYNELVGAGAPLNPALPDAILALRAIDGVLTNYNEPEFRLLGIEPNNHATAAGVAFYNSGQKQSGVDMGKSMMALNTTVHDLAIQIFGQHFLDESGSPDKEYTITTLAKDGSGNIVETPYPLADLLNLRDERIMMGHQLTKMYPPYHYAITRVLLEMNLIDTNTLSYQHAAAYINAADIYLPALSRAAVTTGLSAMVQQYIAENGLEDSLRITTNYEKSIVATCPAPVPGAQNSAAPSAPSAPCLR